MIFQDTVLPILRAHGKTIGQQSLQGRPHAMRVVQWYTLLMKHGNVQDYLEHVYVSVRDYLIVEDWINRRNCLDVELAKGEAWLPAPPNATIFYQHREHHFLYAWQLTPTHVRLYGLKNKAAFDAGPVALPPHLDKTSIRFMANAD